MSIPLQQYKHYRNLCHTHFSFFSDDWVLNAGSFSNAQKSIWSFQYDSTSIGCRFCIVSG